MYGKITNGNLERAPKEFHENGFDICGFTDGFMRERGYKTVKFADYPNDNKEYVDSYTESEDSIDQSWTEVE